MLGVRLAAEDEAMLDRHARAVGRTKSAVVRDWIKDRLEQESADARLRRAANVINMHERTLCLDQADAETDAFLRMLDELDGGYDWGPEGPPAGRSD